MKETEVFRFPRKGSVTVSEINRICYLLDFDNRVFNVDKDIFFILDQGKVIVTDGEFQNHYLVFDFKETRYSQQILYLGDNNWLYIHCEYNYTEPKFFFRVVEANNKGKPFRQNVRAIIKEYYNDKLVKFDSLSRLKLNQIVESPLFGNKNQLPILTTYMIYVTTYEGSYEELDLSIIEDVNQLKNHNYIKEITGIPLDERIIGYFVETINIDGNVVDSDSFIPANIVEICFFH